MTVERTRLRHAGFEFYTFSTAAARAEFRTGRVAEEFVELYEEVHVGALTFPLFFLGERTLRGKVLAQAELEAR